MTAEIISSESSTQLPQFNPQTLSATSSFVLQGDTPLLDAEGEHRLGTSIREQEELTWELLLTIPKLAGFIIGQCSDIVAEDESAIALAKKLTNGKLTKRGMTPVARNLAVVLRAGDLDRVHIDQVMKKLATIEKNRHEMGRNLPFNPTTQSFVKPMKAARRAYRSGLSLREQFIQSNLRLVISMARRYQRQGMTMADLVQEGTLGLMHAIGRFEPSRGLRFSTYACWWIRHAMGRATADKSRAVRVPVHMQEAYNQVLQVRSRLASELGREPTDEEIAARADVPAQKLRHMHLFLMNGSTSLDRQVSPTDDRTVGDLIAAEQAESMEEKLTREALKSRLESLMHNLNELELQILQLRFGLGAKQNEMTFREIGARFNLSRERIRQIQNGAISKLRRAMMATSAPREKLQFS